MFKPRSWMLVALIIAALGVSFALPTHAQQGQGKGYWYTVKPGDSWWSISAETGVPVGALQAANRQAIHPNLWLWRGERIWIPTDRVTEQRGYWYIVQPGDSWLDLAIRTGVSVQVLKRLNPHAVHPNDWMWAGDKIFIPTSTMASPPQPTPIPTVATSPTAEMVTPVPTQEARPTATLAAKPVRTPLPTPTGPAGKGTASSSGEATPAAPSIDIPCPETPKDAGTVLGDVFKAAQGHVEQARAWLSSCGLIRPDSNAVVLGDLDGNGQKDVVLLLQHVGAEGASESVLTVLQANNSGYTPVYNTTLPGSAKILRVGDVNQDGNTDIVLTAETCGPKACITEVKVLSWQQADQEAIPFSEGEISMPNATVQLEDVTPDPGLEIVLHGGVIPSISAGPQRSWTEIWASIDGGPYQLEKRQYDPSPCLYHWVLDGNTALKEGRFDEAAKLFQKVVSDPGLQPCWLRPNEEEELRTFGWFRLALSYAYGGHPDMVDTVVRQAVQVYKDAPYIQALEVWYQTYNTTHDVQKACEALKPIIDRNPILWEMLADYGDANPTFGPRDVCPVLKAEKAKAGADKCPQDLDAVLEQVQRVLNASPGDIMGLYTYLRDCKYVGDAYGGVGAQDINGDSTEEIFAALNAPAQLDRDMPKPGLLVAFGRDGDTYTLLFQKAFSDTVTLLALEDLNQDGQADVAWKTVQCETPTSCEVHANIFSWTGQTFAPWLQGEAVGYNARVEFADKGPGTGQELLLVENAYADNPSDLPERTQIWASVSGKPYTLYDIAYGATTCARYVLDEAEVAFETAQRFGWDRVFTRLQKVLDDENLTPCRTDGTPADQELATIRSFADMRLMQAYAYTGQMEAAEQALQELEAKWPESPFTTLAQQWWRVLKETNDVARACQKMTAAVNTQPDILTALGGYPVRSLLPRGAEDMCPQQ